MYPKSPPEFQQGQSFILPWRLTQKQTNKNAHSKKLSTHFIAANTMQSQLPKVCLQKINTCSYRNFILIMIFIHFLSAYSFFALLYSTQFNLIYSTSFRPLHFVTIRLTQCPRTDLNKRFLPRPKTTTAWNIILHRSKISKDWNPPHWVPLHRFFKNWFLLIQKQLYSNYIQTHFT